MIIIPQDKKNHIKSKRVKYLRGDTKDIFHLLKKPYEINAIFHFGEFARIYQSFPNMNECISSNTIGSNAVFNFCLKIILNLYTLLLQQILEIKEMIKIISVCFYKGKKFRTS